MADFSFLLKKPMMRMTRLWRMDKRGRVGEGEGDCRGDRRKRRWNKQREGNGHVLFKRLELDDVLKTYQSSRYNERPPNLHLFEAEFDEFISRL
jgi:hypothetical protein